MEATLDDIAVVIGMPRAGTTWLYENLKSHPGVCVSDYKEINRYLVEMTDERYQRLFKDGAGRIKLDISPLYYLDRDALRQIAARHTKVILLVREEKAWLQSVRNQVGKYNTNVDQMVESGVFTFPVTKDRTLSFNVRDYDQAKHIAEIEAIFGDKLLKIDFNEVETSPVRLLQGIESFLGIPAYFDESNVVTTKINASGKPISKLYSFLVRTHILGICTKIALAVLPKRLIHWLRARFVYGR